MFKLTPDSKKQYVEILVNGKTGIRHITLIDSIPYVKDDNKPPSASRKSQQHIAMWIWQEP